MSMPNRVFHLLNVLNIEQKKFAEEIGLTDKVVSKWKSGGLKSYTKYLTEIVGFFGVPPDYFLERGVFKNWEEIMKYPVSVYSELRNCLPEGSADPMIGRGNDQIAWLDKRMCYNPTGRDEIDLINWFYRNIDEVKIIKENDIPERYDPAEVTVKFKHTARIALTEHLAQSVKDRLSDEQKEPIPVGGDGQSRNIIKIAGRDGSLIERQLTDEQVAALKLMLAQLPEVDDL